MVTDKTTEEHLDDVDKEKEQEKKDVFDNTENEEVEQLEQGGGGTGDKTSAGDEAVAGGVSNFLHELKDETSIPLVGYFLASMIFLVSVCVYPGMKWYGYGLSVGIVGMILGLCVVVVTHYKIKSDYQTYMAWLLLLWATICAFLFTFANSSPFRFTGNGYFALWGMVVSAGMHAGLSKDSVKETVAAQSSYSGLLVLAVVVVIATSFVVAEEDGYTGFQIYRENTILMISVACITVVWISCILYYHHQVDNNNDNEAFKQFQGCFGTTQFGLMLCFCILWIVSAGLVTFQGPFTVRTSVD
mmetsp:Transcript_55380/g.134495  ORF Transcript_55380/g.134495 Transcript_55380/m.134495 type:complete len:301 (-) Transcript_55380:34-936(-)